MKKEGHSVSTVCKVLRIPESSYYRKRLQKTIPKTITDKKAARIQKESSLLEIIKQIKGVHLFWGYRRVRAYLKRKLGITVSYNRVYGLMKKNCLLVDRKSYKAKRTPQRDKPKPEKSNITASYSNPKGNANTERFMRTFKEEIIYPNEFDSFDEAKNEVDKFIKFYNEDYPHSTLGYLSPTDFEKLNNIKNVA